MAFSSRLVVPRLFARPCTPLLLASGQAIEITDQCDYSFVFSSITARRDELIITRRIELICCLQQPVLTVTTVQ